MNNDKRRARAKRKAAETQRGRCRIVMAVADAAGNPTVCKRCRRVLTKDAADLTRWNTDYRHGFIEGHVCPDCQTPEENAEAEVNLITPGGVARVVQATDEEYGEAIRQHVVALAGEYWDAWLEQVAALPEDASVPFEPDVLADRTMRELREIHGEQVDIPDHREVLAALFRGFADEARAA
jgi:hypothetical protein